MPSSLQLGGAQHGGFHIGAFTKLCTLWVVTDCGWFVPLLAVFATGITRAAGGRSAIMWCAVLQLRWCMALWCGVGSYTVICYTVTKGATCPPAADGGLAHKLLLERHCPNHTDRKVSDLRSKLIDFSFNRGEGRGSFDNSDGSQPWPSAWTKMEEMTPNGWVLQENKEIANKLSILHWGWKMDLVMRRSGCVW